MLYMAVTSDKYELPIAVARSQSELARTLRTTPRAISSKLHHGKQYGKFQRDYKVIRINAT